MYPSEFRSQFKAQTVSEPIDLSALKKEALDIIIDYYNEYNFTHGETYERTRKTQNLIDVNYTDKLTPIRMVATNLLEINDTKKIFDEEIKKNIISIQKDIKFKNILLSDLFDNGLHLFYVDELGEKKLSIVIFKRIISFLEENDLKPYFKFVYNPYYMELNEYKEYCSIFIDYIRLNFTRDYLNSWMISFSCIDNIKSRLRYDFYLTSKELYIQLKKITKNILFGTPTFTKYAIMNTSALDEYLSFCATNNITYDFLSVSYLSNDKNYLQVDKDELKEFINFLRNKNQFKENALCIENFNFTASDNLLNDTLYASSYLCKNIIDNVKSLFALSKASLCDLYLSSSTDPFDGKNGMITYNSIKKASYNVYILISKLGPQLLKKSQNYIITLKDNKIIILVNNYNHYSKLYAENEYYFISKTSRYTCFPKSTDIIFQFSINGIPYKKCKIKTTYLNTTSGSSYDKTLSLGDIELFDDHDFENLKSISEMNFKLETQNIENQVLKIETTLSPLETQLIEIELL
jgi:beta-xylosidase